MDSRSVQAEGEEADEEVLSDTPVRLGGYANADKAVGYKAYAGFVADTMLEVDADLTVEP